MNSFEKLLEYVLEIGHLKSAAACLNWEQEVFMPAAGAESRAMTLGALEKIIHQKTVSSDYKNLLETAEVENNSTKKTPQAFFDLINRELEQNSCLSEQLAVDLAVMGSKAQLCWSKAREDESLVDEYKKVLQEFIELKKQALQALSDYRAKGESIYDLALDQFEPGLNKENADEMLEALGDSSRYLLEKIGAKAIDESVLPEFMAAPLAEQVKFAEFLVSHIGFSNQSGRLDVSTHPFTQGLHPLDVRLTARYTECDMREAVSTALHEGGHGLYEQGLPNEWALTPLGEALGLGMHESQSRFYENVIGKSLSFWKGVWAVGKEFIPLALYKAGPEKLLEQLMRLEKGWIRVEADEVRYNMHILLRYRLEKMIFEEDLSVEELEEAWNNQSQLIFGEVPPTPGEGWLQDVHWSAGLFGYFPTYSLGNIYASVFKKKVEKDIPDLNSQLEKGNMKELLSWFRKNVHSHGSLYNGEQILEMCGAGKPSAKDLLSYLEEKYS
jgi:carboxypeptidase Taq